MMITAKVTVDGKTYIGKRDYKPYTSDSKMSAELLRAALKGQKQIVQASIRDAVLVKHGIKKTTTNGVATDYSKIESV